MPTAPIRLTTASDYAVLECGDRHFYYGYEFERDAEGREAWGWRFTDESLPYPDQVVYRLSFAVMEQQPGCPDQFDTQACLLFGIGLWLMEA